MEIKYLQFTYLLKNMKEMSLNMHFFFGRGGGDNGNACSQRNNDAKLGLTDTCNIYTLGNSTYDCSYQKQKSEGK